MFLSQPYSFLTGQSSHFKCIALTVGKCTHAVCIATTMTDIRKPSSPQQSFVPLSLVTFKVPIIFYPIHKTKLMSVFVRKIANISALKF